MMWEPDRSRQDKQAFGVPRICVSLVSQNLLSKIISDFFGFPWS